MRPLPENKPGQAETIFITGTDSPDAGHWFSPEVVKKMMSEQAKSAPVLLTDDIERLRLLTFCGCGDQFSSHDPGTCGACVAGMTCKPAPVLLTHEEIQVIHDKYYRPMGPHEYALEIQNAVLKKNGITT